MNRKKEYVRHMKHYHYIAPFTYTCDICGDIYTSVGGVKDHKLKMHKRKHQSRPKTIYPENELIFACTLCPNRKYPFQDSLTKHMQIKHGYKSKFALKNELIECEECDEKVKRKNLSLHKFKNHEHNLCFCCGTKFEDFELFTLHQSSLPENKTEQELFSCDKCEFKCSTPGGLKRHFSRNHETNKIMILV